MKKFKKNTLALMLLEIIAPCALSVAVAAPDDTAVANTQKVSAASGSAAEDNLDPEIDNGASDAQDTSFVSTSANTTIDRLLKQAKFWHDRNQFNKAAQALNRVLLTEPNNEDALYFMSLWSSEINQLSTARTYRERLAKAHPQSAYLQQLDNLHSLSEMSTEQLNHARNLSSSGNVVEAIAEYKKLFNGSRPPQSLVSEYYLTMSGDKNYYDKAVRGIVEYIRDNPNDINAQVTYGKILTYRKNTLRKGIEVLDYYAARSSEADKALHKALLWLEPTVEDDALYSKYAERHGQNSDVARHYNNFVIGNMTREAYSESEDNKEEAIQKFKKILEHNPNNQDALEATGYLYLALKNYTEAARYLEKAANQGGTKGEKLSHDALLARVNATIDAKDYAKASSMIESILRAKPGAADVLYLKADMNRRLKNYAQAEDALKTVLKSNPADEKANEILYYMYKEQGKTSSAEEVLARMPVELQDKIRLETAGKPFHDPIPGIRQSAKSELAAGNAPKALSILTNGLKAHPGSPWLRHDLAETLYKQGRVGEAYEEIRKLSSSGASNESLFAAASLYYGLKDYSMALKCAERITVSDSKTRQLREAISRSKLFAEIEGYIKTGNSMAALNTMQSMKIDPDRLTISEIGHLAYLYLKCGNRERAVDYANLALSKPISSNSSLDDYSDVISVFNQTGNYDKSRMIANNQTIVANSSAKSMNLLKSGDAIRRADKLRELNRYADAYDVLYPLIQDDPEEPGVNMAMARIYQDNGMYDESYAIYDSILRKDPDQQEALQGAIAAALGNNDKESAAFLAERVSDTSDPRVLVLLSRVDSENKNYQGAIAKLNRARSLLDSRYAVIPDNAQPLSINEDYTQATHQPGNPFSNSRGLGLADRQTKDKVNLPWSFATNVSQEPKFTNISPKDRKDTLNEINFRMRELQEKVSTTVKVQVLANQKDGEDGLSKVTGAEVPIRLTTPVLDSSRLELTVTPQTMSPGSLDTENAEKFGTNALNIGLQNMVGRVNALIDAAVAGASNAGSLSALKSNLGLSSVSDYDFLTLIRLGKLNPNAYPLTTVLGRADFMNYLSRFDNPQQLFSAISAASTYNTLMSNARVKKHGGVAFDLAFADDDYRAALGVTPVGKKGTTLTGQLFYRFNLNKNNHLGFDLRRSAMKDSTLSYYGYQDMLSGTYWGGVTKNGASVSYSYDDGFFGAHASASYNIYRGKNVLKNHSYGVNAGVYVHPFKPTLYQDVTAGIDFSYENFEHNENNFTFGHGGYFSPQNHFLVTLPVTYRKKTKDLEFNAKVSLGYQSYSLHEEDYYPTNLAYQNALQILSTYGMVKRAKTESKTKSGLGGSARVSLDYYVLDDLVLGGYLNYSTFGEYKEMSEMLYIKSILGGF